MLEFLHATTPKQDFALYVVKHFFKYMYNRLHFRIYKTIYNNVRDLVRYVESFKEANIFEMYCWLIITVFYYEYSYTVTVTH